MFWNINNPPVIIYNVVKELAVLAASSNSPKTQAQTLKIGVEMIQKTKNFETGLSKWFERPVVEHTWHIFKSHFTDFHNSLN